MDRGAWWAAVHGVTDGETTTEATEHRTVMVPVGCHLHVLNVFTVNVSWGSKSTGC